MTGETDLDRLIETMNPELRPGVFVFAALPPGAGALAGATPVMQFAETEGTTLILERGAAETAGLEAIYPCRMITLKIHSSLEAIGFLARITTRLAGAGISVNPISAFYHDHLFVPEDRAEEAMGILQAMAG